MRTAGACDRPNGDKPATDCVSEGCHSIRAEATVSLLMGRRKARGEDEGFETQRNLFLGNWPARHVRTKRKGTTWKRSGSFSFICFSMVVVPGTSRRGSFGRGALEGFEAFESETSQPLRTEGSESPLRAFETKGASKPWKASKPSKPLLPLQSLRSSLRPHSWLPFVRLKSSKELQVRLISHFFLSFFFVFSPLPFVLRLQSLRRSFKSAHFLLSFLGLNTEKNEENNCPHTKRESHRKALLLKNEKQKTKTEPNVFRNKKPGLFWLKNKAKQE